MTSSATNSAPTPPARARAAIELMAGYHSPQLDVRVRLNTNESPYPPPEQVAQAVARAAGDVAWHRYPDRNATLLRERLAQRHDTTADRVFVANGSNEVLQCLLLAYAAAGRTAALFEPTYAMHGHLLRVVGAKVAQGQRGDDFAVDVTEAQRLIAATRPALTFLCSPNNPTGLVEPRETIVSTLEAARAAGGLLCVDEAYAEFAPHSALELQGATSQDPLVVTRTYSKAWAMAGLRLGYLIGPPWVVAELEKVALPYHLDSLKQAAGIAALEHEEAMRDRVAALVSERERLSAGLEALPMRVWPSSANYILFRPTEHSGNQVWQELVDRSVLVRNCSSWPRFEGCLRVTVGAPDENDQFLAALEEITA